MFGHDNQNDNTNQNNSSGSLPFDPSTVSLGSATNDTSADAPSTAPTPAPTSTPHLADTSSTSTPDDHLLETGNDDLISIKQTALKQLSPLVGHLDQTPEEKFRTTMMMIQASDDQSLIQTAYEAANAITDDKARAQALLDIINEINYFTQQQQED